MKEMPRQEAPLTPPENWPKDLPYPCVSEEEARRAVKEIGEYIQAEQDREKEERKARRNREIERYGHPIDYENISIDI